MPARAPVLIGIAVAVIAIVIVAVFLAIGGGGGNNARAACTTPEAARAIGEAWTDLYASINAGRVDEARTMFSQTTAELEAQLTNLANQRIEDASLEHEVDFVFCAGEGRAWIGVRTTADVDVGGRTIPQTFGARAVAVRTDAGWRFDPSTVPCAQAAPCSQALLSQRTAAETAFAADGSLSSAQAWLVAVSGGMNVRDLGQAALAALAAETQLEASGASAAAGARTALSAYTSAVNNVLSTLERAPDHENTAIDELSAALRADMTSARDALAGATVCSTAGQCSSLGRGLATADAAVAQFAGRLGAAQVGLGVEGDVP